MKYLKRFNDHSGYTEFCESGEMVRPNVCYCLNEDEVHYNDRPKKMIKTVQNLNYVNGSGTFSLNNNQKAAFDSFSINGVEYLPTDSVNLTSGRYSINYTLKDEYVGTIPSGLFYSDTYEEFIIPNGTTTIMYNAFNWVSFYKFVVPDTVQTVENYAFICCIFRGQYSGPDLEEINPNAFESNCK